MGPGSGKFLTLVLLPLTRNSCPKFRGCNRAFMDNSAILNCAKNISERPRVFSHRIQTKSLGFAQFCANLGDQSGHSQTPENVIARVLRPLTIISNRHIDEDVRIRH
jgi:hypothetical protein